MMWTGHAINREIGIGMMGADIEEVMAVMVVEENGEEEAVTAGEVTKPHIYLLYFYSVDDTHMIPMSKFHVTVNLKVLVESKAIGFVFFQQP